MCCLPDTLRWPDTVFARAFADAIQHVHKDFKKKTCRQFHFIYSTPTLPVLFFSIIERSVLMALVFYYKDMLEKVTMQRTQQFSAFVCYRKNPVKCNACAVAGKIETDCFSRNVPISNDPVVRILRNLAKNRLESTWLIYQEKSEFWHREFFKIQKTINGKLQKSPMSKFY